MIHHDLPLLPDAWSISSRGAATFLAGDDRFGLIKAEAQGRVFSTPFRQFGPQRVHYGLFRTARGRGCNAPRVPAPR